MVYRVIMQSRFSIIFSEWCGKTKVETRRKIVEYVQAKKKK